MLCLIAVSDGKAHGTDLYLHSKGGLQCRLPSAEKIQVLCCGQQADKLWSSTTSVPARVSETWTMVLHVNFQTVPLAC